MSGSVSDLEASGYLSRLPQKNASDHETRDICSLLLEKRRQTPNVE